MEPEAEFKSAFVFGIAADLKNQIPGRKYLIADAGALAMSGGVAVFGFTFVLSQQFAVNLIC